MKINPFYLMIVVCVVLFAAGTYIGNQDKPDNEQTTVSPGAVKAALIKRLYRVDVSPEEAMLVDISFITTDIVFNANSINIWQTEEQTK